MAVLLSSVSTRLASSWVRGYGCRLEAVRCSSSDRRLSPCCRKSLDQLALSVRLALDSALIPSPHAARADGEEVSSFHDRVNRNIAASLRSSASDLDVWFARLPQRRLTVCLNGEVLILAAGSTYADKAGFRPATTCLRLANPKALVWNQEILRHSGLCDTLRSSRRFDWTTSTANYPLKNFVTSTIDTPEAITTFHRGRKRPASTPGAEEKGLLDGRFVFASGKLPSSCVRA